MKPQVVNLTNMNVVELWVFAPCCLVEDYQRFQSVYCLHLQGGDCDARDLKTAICVVCPAEHLNARIRGTSRWQLAVTDTSQAFRGRAQLSASWRALPSAQTAPNASIET